MSKIRVNEIESTDELTLLTVANIKAAVDAFQSGTAGLTEQQVLDLLVANNYLTQTQIQTLINASSGGLTEQQVLDLLVANNYLTQTQIQTLINASSGGLTEQQVLDLLVANNYLTQTQIQTLINSSTTDFLTQIEIQSLIDLSTADFLTDLEIQSLIDTSTANFLTLTEIQALNYVDNTELTATLNSTIGIDFNARIGDTVISISGRDQSNTALTTKGFTERNQDIKIDGNNFSTLKQNLDDNKANLSVDFSNENYYEYVNDSETQLYMPIGYTDLFQLATSSYGLLFDNSNGEISVVNNNTGIKEVATLFTPLPSGVIGNATIIELDFDLKENPSSFYTEYLVYNRNQDDFVYILVDTSFITPQITNVTEFNLGGVPASSLGVNLYSNTTDGSCSFYLIASDDIIYDVQVDATGTVLSKAQYFDLLGTDYNIIQSVIENELFFTNQPTFVKDFNDGYQNSIRLFDKNRSAFYLPLKNIFDDGTGTIVEERAAISLKSDPSGNKTRRVYLQDNPNFPGSGFDAYVIQTNTTFTNPGLVVDLTVAGTPILSQYTVPNNSGLTYLDFEGLYFGSGATVTLNPPVFDPDVGLYYFELDNGTTNFDIFFDTNFNGAYGNQFETDFALGTESINGISTAVETFITTITHTGATVVGDIQNYADFSKTISSFQNYTQAFFDQVKLKQEFFQSINSVNGSQNFSFAALKYVEAEGISQVMFFIDNTMLGSLLGSESAYTGKFRPIYHDSIDNSLICQIGGDIRKIKMTIDHKTMTDLSENFEASNYEILTDVFEFQSSPIGINPENFFNTYGKNINEYYTVHFGDLELPALQNKEQMFFLPSYNSSIDPIPLGFDTVTNQNLTYIIDLPKYYLLKKLNNGIDRYWTKTS